MCTSCAYATRDFPYNDTFKLVCGWAYSDTDLRYFSPSLHAVYKVGHCWQLHSLKWLLLKKLWNRLARNRYCNIFTESDILATIISSINRHALDRGLCQTATGITHEILLIVNGNNFQCPFKSPGLTPRPWVPDPESWGLPECSYIIFFATGPTDHINLTIVQLCAASSLTKEVGAL